MTTRAFLSRAQQGKIFLQDEAKEVRQRNLHTPWPRIAPPTTFPISREKRRPQTSPPNSFKHQTHLAVSLHLPICLPLLLLLPSTPSLLLLLRVHSESRPAVLNLRPTSTLRAAREGQKEKKTPGTEYGR